MRLLSESVIYNMGKRRVDNLKKVKQLTTHLYSIIARKEFRHMLYQTHELIIR